MNEPRTQKRQLSGQVCQTGRRGTESACGAAAPQIAIGGVLAALGFVWTCSVAGTGGRRRDVVAGGWAATGKRAQTEHDHTQQNTQLTPHRDLFLLFSSKLSLAKHDSSARDFREPPSLLARAPRPTRRQRCRQARAIGVLHPSTISGLRRQLKRLVSAAPASACVSPRSRIAFQPRLQQPVFRASPRPQSHFSPTATAAVTAMRNTPAALPGAAIRAIAGAGALPRPSFPDAGRRGSAPRWPRSRCGCALRPEPDPPGW